MQQGVLLRRCHEAQRFCLVDLACCKLPQPGDLQFEFAVQGFIHADVDRQKLGLHLGMQP
ncbi:hypothetical protein D3C76_1083800 [compost metagenome]